MGFGGAMLALSAVQGVSQISQGYAQQAENKFNATILEGKANLIDAQSDIEQGQYAQMKSQYLSKGIANTAKAGIMPQGSAMAAMIETQRQIGIDSAIAKFNSQQEKNYTMAQADQQRRAGKQAVYTGYSNAFSSLLSGTSNYAMYSKGTKGSSKGGK